MSPIATSGNQFPTYKIVLRFLASVKQARRNRTRPHRDTPKTRQRALRGKSPHFVKYGRARDRPLLVVRPLPEAAAPGGAGVPPLQPRAHPDSWGGRLMPPSKTLDASQRARVEELVQEGMPRAIAEKRARGEGPLIMRE